jgi:cell division protein FtsX
VFGISVKYIVPPFLAAGIVTGIALGVFCELFTAKSLWYKTNLHQAKLRPKFRQTEIPQ